MRYISAQPLSVYWSWQVDTMINSFIKAKVDPNKIDIVFCDHSGTKNENKDDIEEYFYLKNKYQKVNFYLYPDTRVIKTYISSIRPHILAKHFYRFPDLYKGAFLYHDCDIVLTKPLDVERYLYNKSCYLSDTISYIGYNYIMTKGEDVLDLMCQTANIDKEIVKKNEDFSGGCQYLLKDIDYKFWQIVEEDCRNLYINICKLNQEKIKKNKDHKPLQIWCADMWAVLWGLWKINKKTYVIDELDFTWANHNIENFYKFAIYHNAGVVKVDNKQFHKGLYRVKKPPKDLDINPDLACYEYYRYVKQIL